MQPSAFAWNAIGESAEDHRGWFDGMDVITVILTCTADGKRKVREYRLSYNNSRKYIFGVQSA